MDLRSYGGSMSGQAERRSKSAASGSPTSAAGRSKVDHAQTVATSARSPMSGLQGRHEMPPDQHHAARLQPRIHFGARETRLSFLGAEQGAGAVNCRIERRPGGLAV